MSRIIRQQNKLENDSNNDSNKIKIGVRSFAFSQELLDGDEVSETMSVKSMLDEQHRLKQQLHDASVIQQQQFEAQRQQLEEELSTARNAWEEEKLQLQQQAYEAGFSEGFNDGVLKAQDEMKERVQEANEVVHSAVENGNAYVQAQEKLLIELGIRSAQRIVEEQLDENPALYLHIINRALKEAREAEFVKIFTSIRYYEIVTNNREEFATLFPPSVQFTIFVDETLSDNECYLETNSGRVIVTLDKQLHELKKGLLEIIESVE